jgi:hypothetical protein
MGIISIQVPQIGQPDTTEDVKIQNALNTIVAAINGNLDATNLTAAISQSAGINASGQTVKGSSIIATSQNTGSTSFTTLSTPDQVTGIVLPTNGLIQVWYQATWQQSISGAATAAIFLGASQLLEGQPSGPTAQQITLSGNAAQPTLLFSGAGGLTSFTASTSYPGDATTGQTFGSTGSPVSIFAAAGTYTVSVQFKASSGTVTAANRRLYVEASSFA